MPTVTKITKDMILDASFDIAREKGMEEVSNREIAKRLNCSIRPIYYQFKNTSELKMELYNKIEKYFYTYLLNNISKDMLPYKQVGIKYINFAREENNLFRILFMSKVGYLPDNFITRDYEDYKELEGLIKISTKLSDEDIKAFHIKMWIFTHGIAALIATNTVEFSEKQIQELLTEEFQSLMLFEKQNKQ